jgi:hypothetical protein
MKFIRLAAIVLLVSSLDLHAQPNANRSEGADIGAQVNASAKACIPNSPCHIAIPPGTNYTFTTPIIFVKDETLECSPSGSVDNSGSTSTPVQLSYVGSGIAVTMNQGGGRLVGCSLVLGLSASEGIRIGGQSNQVQDTSVSGGGVATKLVHISGTGTEDNHVANSRIFNFVGSGVYVDHANDTFLTDDIAYGVAGNTTGVSLTIDSAAGGTAISNFSGGNSGAHGLVIKNSFKSDLPPMWIFASGVISDISASDGWLFDSSLGSANIGATFANSWSAGSRGAGIRISGGSMIYIGGGTRVRSNQLDGILIDSNKVVDLTIEGNKILGNNMSNVPGNSGIRVTAHVSGLIVTNNTIGNYPEVGGHQAYAFYSTSDIDNVNFSHNNCSNNTISCQNTAAITASKLTSVGNTSESESNLMNKFPSPIETITAGVGGAYLMPFSGSNLPGLGGNLYFDGTNYRTSTDGGSNGGFGLLGSYANGSSCIYSIPTKAPKDPQTISPVALDHYCALSIAPQLISAPAAINAAAGYKYNGTAGFTGTKKAGSCVLTIEGGIITNVTGC